MSVAQSLPNRARALRHKVERAGGELTVSAASLLDQDLSTADLVDDGLICDPPLAAADPDGYVTLELMQPRSRRVERPVVDDPPPSKSERHGFTITKRGGVLALLLLLLGGAGVTGWMLGQGSRLSEKAVTAKVASAVERRADRAAKDRAAAVRSAKDLQRSRDDTRWAKKLKSTVAKEKAASYDSGYSAGNNAGYAAGNSAGYSAGNADGVEEGIETASDELTCSDDSDVALPPCWDF